MADDPEAMRYGFDGFGYKYIDSGSGSDWRTRHPDAEPLYASQPSQSDALLEGDTQTILYLLGVRHGREDERAKIAAEASQPTQSDDEAYDLGKRDGYEKAVQDIDMLTGGDGEYCYSTIEGERHCPNVDTMKARIAERFNSQPKTVTVTVVSAADGKAIHKFKIDPTKKTIVRPEHSLFGYVFEPEEEQSK